MPIGSITQHIDLPQAAIVLFFAAFLGVIFYLRRLDKREGYPLVASPFDRKELLGFPVPPAPKTYRLAEGGTTTAPHYYDSPPTSAHPFERSAGTPLTAIGNPLTAGLGPGAYVMRRDEPMLTDEGEIMLQPLRNLTGWTISREDADPRGMKVYDRRWVPIGTIGDVWIDTSGKTVRLFEVDVRANFAPGPILVPIWRTAIDEGAREMRLTTLEAHQLAAIPMPARPDRITAREDDRLNAYYAAGHFWRDTEHTFRPKGFKP